MASSFREFLLSSLGGDGMSGLFQRKYLRNMQEMALHGYVPRAPVHIDQDDIEFMRQFPHEFWPQALADRYEMLFKSIKALHDMKVAMGYEQLRDAIYQALRYQTESAWKNLHKLEDHIKLPKTYVNSLKTRYQESYTRDKSDSALVNIADKEAHDHIKQRTPHIPGDQEEADFTFRDTSFDPATGKKRSNRTRETITFVAKPFLNRLYHKLETTEGDPHHPESGLEGTGRYGFDMRNPIESSDKDVHSHSTAGMRFPTAKQIRDRVRSFLVLNSHRMFGDIKDPDVKWMKGDGKDTFTVDQVKDKLEAKHRNQLLKAVQQSPELQAQFPTGSEVQKEANRRATEEIKALIKAGKLMGPEAPGLQGHERSPKLTPTGGIEKPNLVLPYKEETVRVKDKDGKVKEVKRWIPVVKDAHLYRQMNDSDFVTEKYIDENGKEQTRRVPKNPDRVTGHNKDFIKVDDEEFQYGDPKGIGAQGSLHLNHRTESIKHLVAHTPEFNQRYKEVIESQQQVVYSGGSIQPAENSGIYLDFLKGVLNCIRSNSCGGKTDFENALMMQSVVELHQLVFQTAVNELDNEKLNTPQSRTSYAKDKTNLYAQDNWGGGTRRKRAFTDEARRSAGQASTRIQSATAPNKLQAFRDMMKEIQALRQRAHEVESSSDTAIQASREDIGSAVVGRLKQIVIEKNNIAEEAADILAAIQLYINGGSKEDATEYGKSQVKSWVEDGLDSEMMIASLQNHPLVKQALAEIRARGGDAEIVPTTKVKPGLEDEQATAIKKAEEAYQSELARVSGDAGDPQIAQKFGAAPGKLSKFVNEDLRKALSDEIQWLRATDKTTLDDMNSILAAAQLHLSQKMAAIRPMRPQPRKMGQPSGGWFDIRREQSPEAQFQLAMNKDYHRFATPSMLKRIHDFIKSHQSDYDPEDFRNALSSIQSSMTQRGIQHG